MKPKDTLKSMKRQLDENIKEIEKIFNESERERNKDRKKILLKDVKRLTSKAMITKEAISKYIKKHNL